MGLNGYPKVTLRPTNLQLIQAIATRAEAAIQGTGRVAGTAKHRFAERMLKHYQGMHGQRGLVTEGSWLGRKEVDYGTRGSVRLDVWDSRNNIAYDYKFTQNPPALSAARIRQIMNQGPNGLRRVVEVNP